MARTADEVQRELDALRQTWRRYNESSNKGGEGFNPHSQALQRLEAAYEALRQAEAHVAYKARLAAEDAEWTREVTIERRHAWNDWVRSQGQTIAPGQLAAHCQAVGYDMLLLSRQIKRHGL
jgi:hypothetical protein